MIKLEKGPTPEHLDHLLREWTDALINSIASGDEVRRATVERRYSDRRVKAALLTETLGKCAYCESRLNETGYPRVEHIVPRRLAPELTFAWENLTIACEICNRNKSDYWDETMVLLNPYVDEPSRHLWAPTEWVQTWRESPRGDFTITKLDLNRGGLIERRRQHLRRIQGLIDQWRDALTPREKAGYWHALQYELAPGKEFLLMTRSLVVGVAN